MDNAKALGFRHDLHKAYDDYEKHVRWLASHGLYKHIERLLSQLLDLELAGR